MSPNKKVYFSNYIDIDNITTKPEITNMGSHRYFIKIPFLNRSTGKTAIVIMKNPSMAGKTDNKGRLLSDDTIYNVCDYLFKSQTPKFKEVIILNIMSIYGGTLSNILSKITSLNKLSSPHNTCTLKKILGNSDDNKFIIAAWGGPPGYKETEESFFTRKDLHSYYDQQIKTVLKFLKGKTVYKVGEFSSKKYPKHGAVWYDYEPLNKYNF
ncbi:DUF1643 domain-containing protein [Lysinibacillus xylanilyticus]|uniref:DUF1643 domain-containing protein n=1 Tax=Lysinibacillus xylanilyticus TaxID=582475 RepID=UPI003D02EE3B